MMPVLSDASNGEQQGVVAGISDVRCGAMARRGAAREMLQDTDRVSHRLENLDDKWAAMQGAYR